MSIAVFRQKAPEYMRRLMADFGFSLEDAAAVMGNAGHESGGLTQFQEVNPLVPGSRGGFGWFQWTGPRRRAFEAYCESNNLDPKSDRANYGWLVVELRGPEKDAVRSTKNAKTLDAKVIAFERSFERAGVKHYASRIKWANRALDAYRTDGRADVAPAPDKGPKEKTVAKSKTVWAAIMAFLSTLLSSLGGADWKVVAVIIVGALMAFIIVDRVLKIRNYGL
jgi:hypothetical protein